MFTIFTSVWIVSSLVPLNPFARLFTLNAIMARVVSSSNGRPTPAEWLNSMLR